MEKVQNVERYKRLIVEAGFASKRGDSERLVKLATIFHDADKALKLLQSKGYGPIGLGLSLIIEQVPEKK